MEDPEPALPWGGLLAWGRQREAVSGDKDDGEEVLQEVSDSRYAEGEHKAEQGQFIVQVQQQHAGGFIQEAIGVVGEGDWDEEGVLEAECQEAEGRGYRMYHSVIISINIISISTDWLIDSLMDW